jgi:hypothetical protein
LIWPKRLRASCSKKDTSCDAARLERRAAFFMLQSFWFDTGLKALCRLKAPWLFQCKT